MKLNHWITAIGISLLFPTLAGAANISSANCTPPKLIVTFASAVTQQDPATSVISQGLSALKFKRSASLTDTVSLDIYGGAWNAGGTTYTVYPTLTNYWDVAAWDVWPIQVVATADGDTSSAACSN